MIGVLQVVLVFSLKVGNKLFLYAFICFYFNFSYFCHLKQYIHFQNVIIFSGELYRHTSFKASVGIVYSVLSS